MDDPVAEVEVEVLGPPAAEPVSETEDLVVAVAVEVVTLIAEVEVAAGVPTRHQSAATGAPRPDS